MLQPIGDFLPPGGQLQAVGGQLTVLLVVARDEPHLGKPAQRGVERKRAACKQGSTIATTPAD